MINSEKSNKSFKRWSNIEDNFLKEKYSLFGSRECAEKLQRSIMSIQTRCKNLKIKMTKEQKSKRIVERIDKNGRKYTIKRDMFLNIATPEVAYILGLLWADGSIKNQGRDSRITITLKSSDAKNVIKIFKKTGNWSIKEVQYSCHKNPVTVIQCCDKILHDYLISLNYLNKSGGTASLIIDKIPENLHHYWWRGYFDGDGYFNFKHNITLQITSVIGQDWSFTKKLPIKVDFSISDDNFKQKDKKYSCSRLSIWYKDGCKAFLDYIYQGNIFGLERKYKIYLNFLKEKIFKT